MKRFFTLFSAVVLLGISSAVSAQSLPSSAEIEFSVVNVSQNNQDAQVTGAKAGDVLRYELNLTSETEDVTGFTPSIALGNLLEQAEITEAGLGQLRDGSITFQPYSSAAPCDESFTFFVRVKEQCVESTVMVSSMGNITRVPLECEVAPLVDVGPDMIDLMFSTLAIMVLLGAMFVMGRRTA